MTPQELKKLSRAELLDLLLAQTKRADDLEQRLQQAEMQLYDKKIQLDKAGSIAQAALQINGIFEAAEAAAAQYLDNIQSLSSRQEALCAKREEESKASSERLLKNTIEKCQAMENAAKKKCSEMILSAEQESKSYWDDAKKRLDEYLSSHDALLAVLNMQSDDGKQKHS